MIFLYLSVPFITKTCLWLEVLFASNILIHLFARSNFAHCVASVQIMGGQLIALMMFYPFACSLQRGENDRELRVIEQQHHHQDYLLCHHRRNISIQSQEMSRDSISYVY